MVKLLTIHPVLKVFFLQGAFQAAAAACVLKVKSWKSFCSVPLPCHPMTACFVGHSAVSSLLTHWSSAGLVAAITFLAVRRTLCFTSQVSVAVREA